MCVCVVVFSCAVWCWCSWCVCLFVMTQHNTMLWQTTAHTKNSDTTLHMKTPRRRMTHFLTENRNIRDERSKITFDPRFTSQYESHVDWKVRTFAGFSFTSTNFMWTQSEAACLIINLQYKSHVVPKVNEKLYGTQKQPDSHVNPNPKTIA